jgi:RNA polymerase sigma-70 factor (ECF subfamily)
MPVALRDQDLGAARRRGFAVAYRMLGSVTEAEDVAQEALIRGALRAAISTCSPSTWSAGGSGRSA